MYKTYVNSFGQLTVYFERNGLLHCAPSDPQNTDYQAYLAWVAEGNVAEEWNPNGN